MMDHPDVRAYAEWCRLQNVTAFPTSPIQLAQHVQGLAAKPFHEILEALNAIAGVNLELGLANPAATPAVANVLRSIAPLDVPRSLPKRQWEAFYRLPFDLQVFMVMRLAEHELLRSNYQREISTLKRDPANAA